MGIFDGLRNKSVSERGSYLSPGLYKVEVQKAQVKKTRSKGDAFILDLKVLETSSDKHPIGTSATWYQSLSDTDIGFGALKGFAASVLDARHDDPEFLEGVEGFLEAAVTENALQGTKLNVEVVSVKTKKGTDFSVHKWSLAR